MSVCIGLVKSDKVISVVVGVVSVVDIWTAITLISKLKAELILLEGYRCLLLEKSSFDIYAHSRLMSSALESSESNTCTIDVGLDLPWLGSRSKSLTQ
jgi:hypothetical protein